MQPDSYWEQLSARVQAVTGHPLPPPSASGSPEFDAIMGQLRTKDPALWKEVLDAVTGSEPLPSEREAAQEQVRRRAASSILAPFTRPDGLRTGKKRLNTMTVLSVAAAAVVAVSLATQSMKPPAPRTGDSGEVASPPAPRAPVAQTAPTPSPRPSPRLEDTARQIQSPPQEAAIPQPPPSIDMPLPPPAPVAASPQQPSPALQARETGNQGSAVLYKARAGASPETQGSAVLYRPPAQAQAGQGQSSLAFKAQQEPVAQQTQPPVLFRASGSRQGEQGQQAVPEPTGQQQEPTRPAVHVGQVFQARLALPVSVSPAWSSVPALAEVTDGPLAGALRGDGAHRPGVHRPALALAGSLHHAAHDPGDADRARRAVGMGPGQR